MGLINEAGTQAQEHVGAVQGGTGKYAAALGVFQQVTVTGGTVGAATPGATPILWDSHRSAITRTYDV